MTEWICLMEERDRILRLSIVEVQIRSGSSGKWEMSQCFTQVNQTELVRKFAGLFGSLKELLSLSELSAVPISLHSSLIHTWQEVRKYLTQHHVDVDQLSQNRPNLRSLTLDPQWVNSTDLQLCMQSVTVWLDNFQWGRATRNWQVWRRIAERFRIHRSSISPEQSFFTSEGGKPTTIEDLGWHLPVPWRSTKSPTSHLLHPHHHWWQLIHLHQYRHLWRPAERPTSTQNRSSKILSGQFQLPSGYSGDWFGWSFARKVSYGRCYLRAGLRGFPFKENASLITSGHTIVEGSKHSFTKKKTVLCISPACKLAVFVRDHPKTFWNSLRIAIKNERRSPLWFNVSSKAPTLATAGWTWSTAKSPLISNVCRFQLAILPSKIPLVHLRFSLASTSVLAPDK